jgi:hypothetical protein
MNEHESQYVLRHLRREHEAMSEELANVRLSLRRELLGEEAQSGRQKTIRLILDLRSRLASHLSEEECDGCLEEAVSRLPSLAHEAMAIVAQQRGLIEDLDRIVGILRAESSPREIASVEVEFEAFAERLADHEKREQLAVQAGLNVAE